MQTDQFGKWIKTLQIMFRNHTNMQDWNDRECATHKPINSSKYFLILPPVINHSQANQVELHIILKKYPLRSPNLPINNKKGWKGSSSHMCNSSLMKYFLCVVSHTSYNFSTYIGTQIFISHTQHKIPMQKNFERQKILGQVVFLEHFLLSKPIFLCS